MNLKLFIGRTLNKIEDKIVRSKSAFVHKNYPYRRNPIFDLKRRLPEPETIIDVGAFIGDVSMEFHTHFKNARIFAFEPVKESFERLKNTVKGIEQIEIFNNAAGDEEETIEIPIYSEPTIATLKPHEYGMPAIAHEKITVIRLDEFFTAHHITKIDILKIDVEGFELQVLRGTGAYLEKVNCIIVEVGYVRCDTKTHFTDMDKFMEDNGYYLFNIYELMPMHNDKGQLCYSNNVYLRHKK